MAITNRYEFVFYIQCVDGNPNGDPDMGNMPRMDPEDRHGYITDVAIKRRIRNYIQDAFGGENGMGIIMQKATNINRFIAEAHVKANGKIESGAKKEKVYAARQWICERYFDVRSFGAVLSTGPNAGQVRGPVQFTFARSVNQILPLDISITRMLSAEDIKNAKSLEEYIKKEEETPEDKLRTMGRKQFIPYGLYEARGFVSANLAQETGFDEEDLNALFEAILNMYENDRSASKGQMSVISPLIIFKHVGNDTNEEQRVRQQKMGCAPAHKLFDLVSTIQKDEVEIPRSYKDYRLRVKLSECPSGVEIGFKTGAFDNISWNTLPDDCEWLICE